MADEKEKCHWRKRKLLVFIGYLATMGNTIETIRELDAASHQKSSAGFFLRPGPSPRTLAATKGVPLPAIPASQEFERLVREGIPVVESLPVQIEQ
jgi:hypothetical protein